MGYKFFSQKSYDGAITRAQYETLAARDKSAMECEIIPNQQLTGKLHKPIIRKFQKRNLPLKTMSWVLS